MNPIRSLSLLCCLLGLLTVTEARAAELSTTQRLELVARLKRLQRDQLQAEAVRVLFADKVRAQERAAELTREREAERARDRRGRSRARERNSERRREAERRHEMESEERGPRREIDPDFAARGVEGDKASASIRPPRSEARSGGRRVQALANNVPINNPAGEEPGSSQNEPAIAAWGPYVLSAYNDWPSLDSIGTIQGYSYSVNGGQSFVDGHMIPSPNGYLWSSDPVIAVNEKSGEFFYCGLLEDTLEDLNPKNAVGTVRGTFTGTTFQWDTPRFARIVFSSEHFLDKPWIAADSLSGNVYVTYSDFFPLPSGDVSNTIQFARTRDKGLTWDPELSLNSAGANGSVQGSRPVIGPNGEVYVTWKEIGPIDPGSDFIKIRKSATRGASFASEATVAVFFDNYGTGAPGFNREKSVALPSIAVDRSRNATRGRLYVTWNESLNWYDDVPALTTPVNETEPNDFFLDPDPFTIGQTLAGTFRDDNDYDSWAFHAVQDSSYVFWADTVSGSTYRLRVWCADSLTRLTYTGHPDLPLDTFGNQGVMVFTAPSTGTYYLDVTNARIEGRAVGTYRIRTGQAHHGPERGRDQRDVFVTTSTNGVNWAPPIRINQDLPHFDNWLPEVASATDGDVYLIWFDWRDASAQCGGLSNVYMALSDNAGATWAELGSVTDQLSNWTYVSSNLIPNQGDYLSLFANENAVYAAWTDGRLGTPDIDGAVLSLLPTELQVFGTGNASADHVTIDWQFVVPRVVQATVYRRAGASRITLGVVTSDAAGHITYVDSTVTRGVEYIYSLGIQTAEGERIVGDVVVSIGGVALQISPNPMRRSAIISYSVPSPGAKVEVEIHDIFGRRVRVLVRSFRGGGAQNVGWDAVDDGTGKVVPPGIYLLRVTVGDKTTSRRITVIP